MANEQNKFDSGHVKFPVAHPSGDLHNIAVPEGTSMEDFHSALQDYYHNDLTPQNQPTREGTLEMSDQFRKAARDAVSASRGFMGNEAAFAVDAQGNPGKIQQEIGAGSQNAHHVAIKAPSNALATLHTHPRRTGADEPSPEDIQVAKNQHHTIYVASQGGLFAVDPGGAVSHVFKSPSWASDKNPK